MNNYLLPLNLLAFRNVIKVTTKARSFLKPAIKPDITRLEYSYYTHEAENLGVKASFLDNNILQLRNNGTVHNVWRSYTDFDGEASLKIAGDKAFCNSVLKSHGVPMPECTILKSGDYPGAVSFKQRINAPIVIKPAKDTGDSKGVFLKPESLFSIWYAVNYAGMFGSQIIAERFSEGTNYRLLFCRGRFLAASSRNPAQVTGDGVHTIRELINIANEGRLNNGECLPYDAATRPILYKIPITKKMEGLVRRQGFNLDSTPLEGTHVQVQEICHWLYGGQYLDVTDIISPDFIDLGKKIVDILGIKLAGIDLIAKDIRTAQQGTYVINEVNTTPGLLVHYEVQNRQELRPVARDIVRTMFSLS